MGNYEQMYVDLSHKYAELERKYKDTKHRAEELEELCEELKIRNQVADCNFQEIQERFIYENQLLTTIDTLVDRYANLRKINRL